MMRLLQFNYRKGQRFPSGTNRKSDVTPRWRGVTGGTTKRSAAWSGGKAVGQTWGKVGSGGAKGGGSIARCGK